MACNGRARDGARCSQRKALGGLNRAAAALMRAAAQRRPRAGGSRGQALLECDPAHSGLRRHKEAVALASMVAKVRARTRRAHGSSDAQPSPGRACSATCS